MNIRLSLSLIGLSILISSCCFSIKEEHLGNNLYLSEFDNIDRNILYSEEECSGSGIVIVPMTVLEYAYDSDWVIAKTGSRRKLNNEYWIIHNIYSDPDKIKSNLLGPLDATSFDEEINKNKITLILKKK